MANNLDKIRQILESKVKKIEEEFLTKHNIEQIAQMAVDLIVKRVRNGYGIVDFKTVGSTGQKLAPLKDSYKKQRKGYLKSKLDSTTSPSKSNLTLSGDMLRDVAFNVVKGKIEISCGTGKNKQKTAWAQDGSSNREPRPFLQLSKSEVSKIKELMKEILTNIMKETIK